jgi:hypothetical protein
LAEKQHLSGKIACAGKRIKKLKLALYGCINNHNFLNNSNIGQFVILSEAKNLNLSAV